MKKIQDSLIEVLDDACKQYSVVGCSISIVSPSTEAWSHSFGTTVNPAPVLATTLHAPCVPISPSTFFTIDSPTNADRANGLVVNILSNVLGSDDEAKVYAQGHHCDFDCRVVPVDIRNRAHADDGKTFLATMSEVADTLRHFLNSDTKAMNTQQQQQQQAGGRGVLYDSRLLDLAPPSRAIDQPSNPDDAHQRRVYTHASTGRDGCSFVSCFSLEAQVAISLFCAKALMQHVLERIAIWALSNIFALGNNDEGLACFVFIFCFICFLSFGLNFLIFPGHAFPFSFRPIHRDRIAGLVGHYVSQPQANGQPPLRFQLVQQTRKTIALGIIEIFSSVLAISIQLFVVLAFEFISLKLFRCFFRR
jgi:hypothetical protein